MMVAKGKDHVRHVLGDVGTGDAHAHADVGALDGRGVVHAVAGHGDDLVAALPGVDDAGLVLGLDAGVDAVLGDLLLEVLVGDLVELGAGDGLGGVLADAEVLGDGHGGVDVVAGDHDRADAGLLGLGDGRGDLRTLGVDHAGEAHEDEVVLERLGAAVGGQRLVHAHGGGEHAQRLVGHVLVGGHDLLAAGVGQGLDGAVGVHDLSAAAENHVGAALGVLLEGALGGLHHDGHHLAAGVERRLAHALVAIGVAVLVEAELGGVVDQGALGGLAHGLALLGIPLGVGAESHGAHVQVVGTLDLVLGDGHLVLRESARLVRADDLGAAERLDGGHLADDGLALGHLGDAHGEHDRDHGHEALGNGGDGQGHGDHEGVEDHLGVGAELAAVADEVDGKDDHADREHQLGEDAGELVELDLERRELLLGRGEGVGDLAHLGLHAGGGDDGAAAAVDHGGAHVAHVLAVAQGHVVGAGVERDRLDVLLHGHGLAGEGGLLDLHRGALQDAAVRRHGVAGLEKDDVAGHEVGGGQVGELAVADDLGLRRAHLLQGLERLLRLCLLHDAEHGVDDDDGHDDDDVGPLGLALDGAGDRRDGGGHDEHDDHRVGHLLEEALPERGLLLLLQLVGPVLPARWARTGPGETTPRPR